jgi:hypothetical protein
MENNNYTRCQATLSLGTKYFIFLDNSGSMISYYTNVKNNLKQMLTLEINPTILAFENLTTELEGANFQEKLTNYQTTTNYTYMEGVVERFTNYLIDASVGQKICVLFITDGRVQDLTKITPFLLTCVDIIADKKLSVYMSCVAINSSADMKAFSLFGLLNNFSIFQLVQSKNGDNWGEQVVQKFREIETCDTRVYSPEVSPPGAELGRSAPGLKTRFMYSDTVVDSRVSESGLYNKVYLASLVQAFTVCNFDLTQPKGFMMCKTLLKHIVDLGIGAKTRYIWSKLNTAKMVGDKNSDVIAKEFISTINDINNISDINQNCGGLSSLENSDNNDNNVSITNEHNVRVRLFVGKTKSFTNCLPITINQQNQIIIQSEGSNELYLNIEVYHPDEPVDLEISYGKSKHRWYVPYGVSLIEGDVKYLMLAHEKLKPANAEDEKMFDFVLKAVPSSLTSEVVAPSKVVAPPKMAPPKKMAPLKVNTQNLFDRVMDARDCNQNSLRFCESRKLTSRFAHSVAPLASMTPPKPVSLASKSFALPESAPFASMAAPVTRQSRAFATVSAETRQIDTIERKRQINPDAHVLCFSFLFVYDSESFDLERLSVPIEIVYVTNECVICMDNDSTVKLKCNHKCMCSLCYESYIRNTPNIRDRKCPMCRQLI